MIASTPKLSKWLQRHFGRQIRSLADFQKWAIGANFAIFGEIAASLAHHPHGHPRKRLAAASAQEQFLAISRLTVTVESLVYRRSYRHL